MDVLLINPPSDHELIGNNPTLIEEERGINPPLGLLYLAAYLQERTSHRVSVLDCQAEAMGYETLRSVLVRRVPDVVGITAMTMTLLDALKTAQLVKAVCPKAITVLGGPHVHLYPRETVSQPGVDMAVVGEGEVPFAQSLDHLHDPAALKLIKGLAFKDSGRIVLTGYPDLITDLDAIPFPARTLTPIANYTSILARRAPVTTLFTSRGCPFQCAFCDRPHLGKRFRCRSARNVVDEMEQCQSLGIHEFLVYDDTFTVNAQRVMDICDEIIRRRLDIGWDIRTRVDCVTEPMLRKLKTARCERIHYGVEAGTESALRVLRKGITLGQVRSVFRMTRRAGIRTLAYFMIGIPSETKSDIMQTIAFMRALNPDFAHITILCPFPGTEIYDQALRRGIIKTDVWRDFAVRPTADFRPPYWEEHLSRNELADLLMTAYRQFYLRPGYVIRQAVRMRSLGEWRRKFKAGLKLARWQ